MQWIDDYYIAHLLEEPRIKNTPMFSLFCDMNVSDKVISDYSNSLHNYKLKYGDVETMIRLLDIFRINPFVAIKMMESCSVNMYGLSSILKIFYEEIAGIAYSRGKLDRTINGKDDYGELEIILNPHKIPYVTLFIEAVYQNSVYNAGLGLGKIIINYAMRMDKELHEKNMKTKYLNGYNLRHIILHIPDNRQIEIINILWDKHCFAAKKYGCKSTFCSRRVEIILNELPEGAIWRHMESFGNNNLSNREIDRLNEERAEIKKFITNVYEEGGYPSFVQRILGSEDFDHKLYFVMNDTIKLDNMQ